MEWGERLRPWAFAFGLFGFAARPAEAAEIGLPSTDRAVEVHGFVSPGFLVSTGNNYLAKSKRGSFEFTEMGINFTVPLTEKLRTGIQLFARDLGPTNNYNPRADWFYLDYRFDDWFGIRAGRVKIPFGFYNDTSDIDAARVPILLPQSIYSLAARDFALAQSGGEIYGRVRTRSLGALEYRLYGGTIFLAPANISASSTIPVTEVDVPFVAGERLIWETPLDGLRLAGSLQAGRLDASFIIPPNTPNFPAGPASLGLHSVAWLGSAEYALHDVQLSAEYGRSTGRVSGTNQAFFQRVVSERGYVMATYRLTDWFWPGAQYGVLFPTVENRSGRDKVQHDVAGTLRFDINHHWLVKLEGHFMSGTAYLDASLNDNTQRTAMEKNWAVFLVKTTAHF
jgi:hypothetical protein